MHEVMDLPRGEKLAKLIREHAEAETAKLSYRYLRWRLAWYVLNGYRHFSLVDPVHGNIRASWMNKDNRLDFQNQEILKASDQVQGRLAGMDLRPKVLRQGLSINSIRSKAVAQIIADAVVSEDQLEKVKTRFSEVFTALGFAGIAGHVDDHATIGLTADLEVIHPMELLPFPSLGQDLNQLRGLIRQRYVPLAVLKKKYGKKVTRNLKNMEWFRQRPGNEVPAAHEVTGAGGLTRATMTGGTDDPEFSDDQQGMVLIREFWLYGPRDTVAFYGMASGQVMIVEQDLDGLEVYCPIGYGRFIENGSFHGAGLFDLLYWINRETERTLKQLFNNVRDIDRYGVLVMPRGTIPQNPHWRDVGKGLRIVDYEADPVTENFKPFHVTPFNSGDVPGKTAAFARDIMQQMNPVRDLIEEKGRIDSGVGLAALDDIINQSLSTPQRGITQAFGEAYREIVRSSLSKVAGRSIPVSNYTLELAGAVIDTREGTISFSDNPLPTISQLRFTVREAIPRNQIARVQQAREFVQEGIQDPQEFRLFILEENHDAALWLAEDKAAYETVVQNILTLYGDGETNQQIVVAEYMSKPELQLRILSAFMGSPLMKVASPEIVNDLADYREELMTFSGITSIANPEQLAAVEGLLMQQTALAQEGQRLADRQDARGISQDNRQLSLP